MVKRGNTHTDTHIHGRENTKRVRWSPPFDFAIGGRCVEENLVKKQKKKNAERYEFY